MCDTCGCGHGEEITFRKPGEDAEHDHHHEHLHTHDHPHEHGDVSHTHPHEHSHQHEHDHSAHTHEHGLHTHTHDQDHHHHDTDHPHEHTHADHQHTHGSGSQQIILEQDILTKNNLLAERNRGYFEAKNIFAINLVSSPGSGKTSLLEKTIKDMGKEFPIYVIEGDQQTMNDANRIDAAGAPVVQINTGNGCHLDSEMIRKAIGQLNISDNSMLMIENVGNLVCPSLFDLGEAARVVIMSTTEGEDKPLKYPTMFRSSQICIINKTDLLPYLDFDIVKAKQYAKQVNPHLEFFEVSVKSGVGMEAWYGWLKSRFTGKTVTN